MGRSFYEKDRDNSVKTIRKDPQELSGIFNLVAFFAKELLRLQSLKYESTVEDNKNRWLLKADSVQNFANDCLVKQADYWCEISRIYSEYIHFSAKEKLTPLKNREFNSKMEKLGFMRDSKSVQGRSVRIWKGCTLRKDLRKKTDSTL